MNARLCLRNGLNTFKRRIINAIFRPPLPEGEDGLESRLVFIKLQIAVMMEHMPGTRPFHKIFQMIARNPHESSQSLCSSRHQIRTARFPETVHPGGDPDGVRQWNGQRAERVK